MAEAPDEATRTMRLRYAGKCAGCGAALPAGATARYDRTSRTATCVVCPNAPAPDAQLGPATAPASAPAAPPAAAGGSAQAQHDRLHARREATLEARWGRFAGVAKFFSDDPQSTKAWAKGAEGERRLARHLEHELGDRAVLLHDRRYRKWNIDHLVLASTGVWVIDAKAYAGRVEYRNRGGWLGSADYRIYVDGRDKTKLAGGLEWQVTAVRGALGDMEVPIQPALCFVNRENWGIRPKPFRHQGVLVTPAQKLVEIIGAPGDLDPEQVEAVARRLSERMKPAM